MTQFTDFNFKLLVIDRLMYTDGTLTPRFDLAAYLVAQGLAKADGDPARAYTEKKRLSHQVLPVARKYFDALEISDELLASVEDLILDGGLRVYYHCSPVWDGEDDLFDVRSLDDLPLLPNLKRIRGADDFWSSEMVEILHARGIATDG
ncbi:DUF6892 domain-containing protein [Streptomyces sp. NPDC001493]